MQPVALPVEARSRPEAKAFKVEDLLRHARAGMLRVPTFQRAFKWEHEDVLKLFDSIWRGYPIGTLLLWAKNGPAGQVTLGERTFDVREGKAWYVVDGQQRIVSLVSTLLPGPRSDKFDLQFDLVKQEVTRVRRGGAAGTHLPLNRAEDSEELLAWLDENRMALTQDQTRLAIRVGKALREYDIPAYIVEVDDERLVREIFERVNATGKRLEVSEVFNALHAFDRQPSLSLKDVVTRLKDRSLGDIEEDDVLRSLLAIEGKDLSGDLQRQLADVDVPSAVMRTERAMDRVFGFLAQDAGIPHLRLLPYRRPLTVLSAYFDRFPTPPDRARRLLVRWLWRGIASEELRGDSKGMRPALEAVRGTDGDERVAARVLATVARERPAERRGEPFNFRHARSRVVAIALAGRNPQHLATGERFDVQALFGSGDDPLPQIFGKRPNGTPEAEAALFSSAGNRLLHAPVPGASLRGLLAKASPAILDSHAVSEAAVQALPTDPVEFLRLRTALLERLAMNLIDSRAEWGHTDRLSIAAMTDSEE